MNRLSQFFNVSNEAIDHQFNGVFKAAIIKHINTLRAGTLPKVGDVDVQLTKIIKTHTGKGNEGLNIGVKFVEGLNAFINLPDLSANNPIVNEWRRGPWMNKKGLELIKASNKAPMGEVDLNRGHVSGVFSETTQTLHLGLELFKHPLIALSDEELAAYVFHEIGHVFTYYEMIAKTTSTNYIIRGTLEQLDTNSDRKQRIQLYKDVESIAGLDLGNLDELADLNDRKAVAITLVDRIDKSTRQEISYSEYDTTGAESLADQYAARHGLALALVTGLDKVSRVSGNPSFLATRTQVFVKIGVYSTMLVTAMVLPIVGLPILTLFLAVRTLVALTGVQEYDELPQRYKRIRHQLVDGLKKVKDDTIAKSITADIAQIDQAIEQVNEHPSFAMFIMNHLIPSKKAASRSKLFQQDLEAMLANDLFIKAVELKQVNV